METAELNQKRKERIAFLEKEINTIENSEQSFVMSKHTQKLADELKLMKAFVKEFETSEKIYAMIAYVHKTYGKELDVIYEKMEELFPVEYEKYKEDTYDGPSDGEAWSGGFADNH